MGGGGRGDTGGLRLGVARRKVRVGAGGSTAFRGSDGNCSQKRHGTVVGPPCASTRYHPHRLGSWEAQLGCYGDGMRGQQVSAEPAEMGRAGVAKCGTPHPLSWSPLQLCQEGPPALPGSEGPSEPPLPGAGTSACCRHCHGCTAGEAGPGVGVSPLQAGDLRPTLRVRGGTSSLGLCPRL